MKKTIATLLAVLLTLGICAVSVVAEDPTPTTYAAADVIKMSMASGTQASEKLTLIKPGDVITMPSKVKKLSVTYYPDALRYDKANGFKNLEWKAYVQSMGKDVTLATSVSKYKYFKQVIGDGKVAFDVSQTVFGLNNEVITAYDSSNLAWGDHPMDLVLKDEDGNDCEFLGWYMDKFSATSSNATIEFYAVWDRGSTEVTTEPETGDVTEPSTEPEERSPIMQAFYNFFNLFSETESKYKTKDDGWQYYLTFVPKLVSALCVVVSAFFTNGDFQEKLYEVFGITKA